MSGHFKKCNAYEGENFIFRDKNWPFTFCKVPSVETRKDWAGFYAPSTAQKS